MLESLSSYLQKGSGWRIVNVEYLEIYISKYKPLAGKSYKPLPDFISAKKAIINMKNIDNMCFKWAITRALNPVDHNAERIDKNLRKQAEDLNWEGIEFPVALNKIEFFEKKNNISINVFSFDNECKSVYTLKLSKSPSQNIINLFYYDEHYSVVKDLSRLLASQISSKKNLKFFCLRCLEPFGTQKLLDQHSEYCTNFDHQKTTYPEEDKKYLRFKNIHKTQKHPFAVYADFESYLNTYDKNIGKSTNQYQKHNPSGFCYIIRFIRYNIIRTFTKTK